MLKGINENIAFLYIILGHDHHNFTNKKNEGSEKLSDSEKRPHFPQKLR